MLVAYSHSSALEGVPAEKMVCVLSNLVLGKFGSLFVCITVSFACLATALALAEVCSGYLHREIFAKKVSKVTCLVIVILVTYAMSNLSFQMIMRLMLPILKVIYPALITLSIMNILYKWRGIKMVKFPVYLTVFSGIVSNFLL
jgi:branched-chain amino acid:cation transporter, LIVCS family